jgi:hypothetical protein
MAHEVRAKIDTKVVAHKDLEVVVKTSRDGKLGTLLISKGNVEWLPKGNSVNRRRLSWRRFADLMQSEGRRVKKVRTT